jgi:nitrite reductase (NO-forming)
MMIKSALFIAGLISGSYFYFFSKNDEIDESIKRGEQVYIINCLNCHMFSGEGVPGTYPPLLMNDSIARNIQGNINVILLGQKGMVNANGESYEAEMPAQAYLTDEQIADVLNYVMNNWGNKGPVYSPDQVKTLRDKM